MKKLIVFFLIGILTFTATACSDNTIKDPEEQKSQNESQPQEEHQEQKGINEIINENIIIGEGTDWELPGTLSLPKDYETKVPAVVLVHGSGPNDMDSTLYENKPFRDIAEYLSANGIAVIRYDKRTLTHGLKIVQELGGNATVYEETIQYAILATEILKADSRIDENRVFIVGLSMGGMLAPRIHAEGGNFAGIISLAGSPRSINDINYDQQMAYVEAMPDGDEKNNYLALLDKELYDAEVAAILSLPDDEAKNSPRPGGVSAYYYKDWDRIPTTEYVKNINIPFLIMQGSADFQVFADKDFVAWQELLAGRQNVTFKLYENLNHIFMQSTGRNITDYAEEYKIKGNVDSQVLEDMANWIKTN